MTLPTALLEPSFLDLVGAIEQATELSEQRRRHWVCSLRQIAKWLDRPATVIPARWQSVRVSVSQLHHARVGVTAKTLANHKSNIRAALRWFGKEHDVPQQGVRLSAEWAKLRDRIDSRMRDRLYSLIRYCSARGVPPSAVNDKIFDEYWRYRTETTARASNNTARRFMARAWNACSAAIDGCPLQRFTEPPIKVTAEPAWDEFPEGLRRGTLTTISPVLPSHTAALPASVSSHAARERSGPAGPNLSRWRAWQFGSARRSRA